MYGGGPSAGRRADERCLTMHPQRTNRSPHPHTKLHHEVVRVLIVDERRAGERLAGLKHLRRPEILQRQRLERKHAGNLDAAACRLARDRHGEPVLRLDDVEVGELALLAVELQEEIAVPLHAP
jgi:hypothetical protein